jgi:hypothetical protein
MALRLLYIDTPPERRHGDSARYCFLHSERDEMVMMYRLGCWYSPVDQTVMNITYSSSN